ncbi:unnamed protein product [Brassica oleracea var. botrytis]
MRARDDEEEEEAIFVNSKKKRITKLSDLKKMQKKKIEDEDAAVRVGFCSTDQDYQLGVGTSGTPWNCLKYLSLFC